MFTKSVELLNRGRQKRKTEQNFKNEESMEIQLNTIKL